MHRNYFDSTQVQSYILSIVDAFSVLFQALGYIFGEILILGVVFVLDTVSILGAALILTAYFFLSLNLRSRDFLKSLLNILKMWQIACLFIESFL